MIVKRLLIGQKIILRPIEYSDASSIAENANDEQVSKYTLLPFPYRIKDGKSFVALSKKWRKERSAQVFGIVQKNENKIIGMIGLHKFDFISKNCELGYWLARKYWQKGIMTEAVHLILKYAFNDLKMEKVWAKAFSPNLASANLLKKNGFKHEGTLRRQNFHNGEWVDQLYFGLLKSEFKM